MTGIAFQVLQRDGKARRGRLETAHGPVETPCFMAVGTAGTVKGLLPDQVRSTGTQVILGNTYHLMLRPGAERVAAFGGLHSFMDWSGPILTDSGGYQVMSLNELRKITEEGVTFRSHVDGTHYALTPERSVEIQDLLDSNITMVLDECTPYPAEEEVAALSMRRSMRWAARSKAAFRQRPGYGLFGIVQGSIYPHLREESAESLIDIAFDGYAIGGLAVGEGQEVMLEVLDHTVPHLPNERPRYLMGVGKPSDLVYAVARGVDMFDCVLPTRSGRTSQAWTRSGSLNLRNAVHRDDHAPLDPECGCLTCQRFSRGYLHHLEKAREMLGPILLSLHNLHYFQDLMAGLRQAIETGTLKSFVEDFEARRDYAP